MSPAPHGSDRPTCSGDSASTPATGPAATGGARCRRRAVGAVLVITALAAAFGGRVGGRAGFAILVSRGPLLAGTPALATSASAAASGSASGSTARVPRPPAWAGAGGGCRVYTYAMDVATERSKMMAVWRKSWALRGWVPTVLTERDAQKHPRYKEYRAHFRTLPTVNRRSYELACFLRWAAVAAAGGGYMSDYDVGNVGLEAPRDCAALPNGGDLTVHSRFVPAMVTGSGAAFGAVLDAMAALDVYNTTDPLAVRIFRGSVGLPVRHVSDMLMMQLFHAAGTLPCSFAVRHAQDALASPRRAPDCAVLTDMDAARAAEARRGLNCSVAPAWPAAVVGTPNDRAPPPPVWALHFSHGAFASRKRHGARHDGYRTREGMFCCGMLQVLDACADGSGRMAVDDEFRELCGDCSAA